MQSEFREIVFEFVKRVSEFENIHSIILFGSVARGEVDSRSDIDFFIIFDTNKNIAELKERGEVSKVALNLEKEYDRNIQLVFSNKNFDKLDRQFIEEVFKEGIILFGKNPVVDIKKLKLMPYTLIYYSLRNLSKSEKMRVKRALYGHTTYKEYKGKIYKSEVKGLIEEVKGKRTGIASILIPTTKSKIFMDILKNFNVEFQRLDVWISQV